MKTNYGKAINLAFEYLLNKYPEVFVIGQGLWSPWYVGNSMTDLDKKFGIDRIIDTPVSESAVTGAGVGASLAGMKPIVIHPRMDFMLYSMDAIINQAAKWSYIFSGQAHPGVTFRAIINRGGEQGAQHSQALHSIFAHIPGLRVVMPSSVKDARDLLISSVLSPDPVLYIDDRWLYSLEDDLEDIKEISLALEVPKIISEGNDITIVGIGFSTQIILKAKQHFDERNISVEIIDLRILNPLMPNSIIDSVRKTHHLIVVDNAWKTCGMASEVIASTMENINPNELYQPPSRLTLPDCPAPTSEKLEKVYYLNEKVVIEKVESILNKSKK
tara:strand:+ start:480 stop:1469 length:990 start_codon:yes stop_codon:yes gene_type:complete